MDVSALGAAVAEGVGRAEVYAQWSVAQGSQVQGSPHVFGPEGYEGHNPGVRYHWTAAPPQGFPYMQDHRADWADDLLDAVSRSAG